MVLEVVRPFVVLYRPKRWRTWFAVWFTAACAVPTVIFVVAHAATNALSWLALLFLVPGGVITLKAGVRSRTLTVSPGHYLEYRDILGRRRRIDSTTATEIVRFADVSGSNWLPIRPIRTPIGVYDERWAVLRNGHKTVLRLSMWVWTTPDLVALAEALPATLRIHSAPITPWAVAKRMPDHYTWLEKHPRTYLTAFYAVFFAMAFAVLGGLVAVIIVLYPAVTGT